MADPNASPESSATAVHPEDLPQPIVLPPLTSGAKPYKGNAEHPVGQVEIIEACMVYDVVVVAFGRRAGKTTTCGFLFMEEGALTTGIYFAGYVAQSHAQAEEMFENMLELWTAAGLVVRHKNKGQDRWIRLRPWGRNAGAKIWFWSGESGAHDGARGKGLHRLIVDEAGFVPWEAWTDTFTPMLVDRKGRALVIGTPKPEGEGFAWFRDEFRAGQDGPNRDPTYKSFNAPSEANPLLDRGWIQRARARARKRGLHVEASEFDALFVEDVGGVFTNIGQVVSLPVLYEQGGVWVGADPREGTRYAAGIDFGKDVDATVVSIFDLERKEQVAVARWQGRQYEQQLPMIDNLLRRYKLPVIVADARDAGNYLVERLREKYGVGVEAVKLSMGGQHDKGTWVTRLADMFAQTSVKLLNIEAQAEEFRLFTKTKLPAGGYRYEAPSGRHDDFVLAAVFAARYVQMDWDGQAAPEPDPEPWTAEWFRRMGKITRTIQGRAGRYRLR